MEDIKRKYMFFFLIAKMNKVTCLQGFYKGTVKELQQKLTDPVSDDQNLRIKEKTKSTATL